MKETYETLVPVDSLAKAVNEESRSFYCWVHISNINVFLDGH